MGETSNATRWWSSSLSLLCCLLLITKISFAHCDLFVSFWFWSLALHTCCCVNRSSLVVNRSFPHAFAMMDLIGICSVGSCHVCSLVSSPCIQKGGSNAANWHAMHLAFDDRSDDEKVRRKTENTARWTTTARLLRHKSSEELFAL